MKHSPGGSGTRDRVLLVQKRRYAQRPGRRSQPRARVSPNPETASGLSRCIMLYRSQRPLGREACAGLGHGFPASRRGAGLEGVALARDEASLYPNWSQRTRPRRLALQLSRHARAGIACPPVPPPAMRILFARGLVSLALHCPPISCRGCPRGEAYQQARPAVAHEGELSCRRAEDHHYGPDVEDAWTVSIVGQAGRDAPGHHRGAPRAILSPATL